MQADRVNLFSPRVFDKLEHIPVEHIIYAQVLETLLQVCNEDLEGTIKYLREGDPKVQNIAALRFAQNHQLENVSKRVKKWSEILSKYNVLQDELPLLFQLFAFQFVFVFHNLLVEIKVTEMSTLSVRFIELKNMCRKIINEM